MSSGQVPVRKSGPGIGSERMSKTLATQAGHLPGVIEGLLHSLVDQGYELGVQTAVYLHGELVAEVCVGRVASASPQAVAADHLFPVCSTGKGILATLVHILAERGQIAYDAPVARYWPEFAAHGKGATTVRQALAHQAGLPQVPAFRSLAEACDFPAACARVAELAPAWPAGSTTQYHSRTWGWIVGGLAERASGRPLAHLLRDEVAGPLGLAEEMFFGISAAADARFSAFEAQPVQREQNTTAPITNAPPPPGTVPELALPLMDFVNLPQVRRCCMPAVNGIMSARAIARHYAALIGPVDGVRLIPAARLAQATTLVTAPGTIPVCFGHGFGLGYSLKGPATDMGAFFGHGGAGGSEGMANRALGLAVGLTKNRMDTHVQAPGHTNRLLITALLDVLGHAGDGGFYRDG